MQCAGRTQSSEVSVAADVLQPDLLDLEQPRCHLRGRLDEHLADSVKSTLRRRAMANADH
jgi:hypothetical protein